MPLSLPPIGVRQGAEARATKAASAIQIPAEGDLTQAKPEEDWGTVAIQLRHGE